MKRIDLTGLKFGKLTATSFDSIKSKAGQTIWECKCDCGNTVERSSYALRNLLATNCGCSSIKGKEHAHWKGCGDISAAWFHKKVTRSALGCYGARRIKESTVTIEELWELFIKQDKKCAYSGLILTFPKSYKAKDYKDATASLDRIDSSKGYIINNVQFVHKDINIMKNVFSHSYFVKMCKLISTNHKNKNAK